MARVCEFCRMPKTPVDECICDDGEPEPDSEGAEVA